MRILLVTRNFPPLVGGMERLLHNVYRILAAECSVALVGPAGCLRYASEASPAASVPPSPLPHFLLGAQWHAIRIAREFRPTLVLSGSGLTAPVALLAARVVGARAVSFVHGLDLVADSRLYRALFLPFIVRSDGLIANSRNTAELAISAGADPQQVTLLHPGVTMPRLSRSVAGSFRRKYNLESRKVLLSVGRLSQRKGLAEFIRYTLPYVVAREPSAVLVVIGGEPSRAIKHVAGQRERILQAAKESGLGDHVLLLGRVDDATLSEAYAEADIFVFPVLDQPGDVEGFGMVALEAAAHGLPTVAFAAGGVPDAVENHVTGHLVPPGDYAALGKTIVDHLQTQTRDAWSTRCIDHARRFAWDRYAAKLNDILRDVCKTPHSRPATFERD